MRWAGLAGIALAAMVLLGAGRAGADGPVPVKIGHIGLHGDIGVFVAQERGYFAEKGLKVEIERIAAAGDVMAMLATNQLTFVIGGYSVTLFNAIIRGLPVRAVAAGAILIPGHDGNVMMVRPDLADAIKTPRDLKGRKLALNSPVSALVYIVGKTLESAGLSLKDVEIVPMPFPSMATALSTKAIDVAFAVEPFVTQIQERKIGVPWKGAADVVNNPYMHVAAIFANHEWAARNERVVQAFVTQYQQGVRAYHAAVTTGKNRDEMIALFTRYTQVKDPALYERMTWPFIDPNGTIVKRSVADQIDWYVRNGLITKRLSVDDVVDSRYADAALRELGSVTCAKCVQ